MSSRFLPFLAAVGLAFAASRGAALAQDAPATPAPAATLTPMSDTTHQTFMDRQYDGKTHTTLVPYIWLPTISQNVQFNAPVSDHTGVGGVLQSNVQVGPSQYAAKLSSAAMFSFDMRKGDVDLFGDYIYVNGSTSANISTAYTGPLNKVHIPVTFSANSRLASSIWEIAAGYTLAHGHNADVSIFGGWREFPVNLTVSYGATIGKKGIIIPSRTFTSNNNSTDVIFGLRGKVFLGDHVYIPYYGDIGEGANNQTWQAYSGAGYAFNHGQTLLLAYRTLNYNAFPGGNLVQKMVLSGPLLGYSLQL